jgi:hypothetical protein
MRRLVFGTIGAMALMLYAGAVAAYAQGTFKIPFKFEAGGKKFPAGEYWLGPKGEGQIALRQPSTGTEVQIPFIKRLDPPKPAVEEPRLVFDMVGNFEPSYTEYVTDYVLAELWLPGQDGFLVHAMKGAHQTQTVKGQIAKASAGFHE